MVTEAGLRGTEPGRITATGVGFRLLAEELLGRAEGVRAGGAALAGGWSGQAAGAATAGLGLLESQLREAAVAAFACEQVLTDLGERVRSARALLDEGRATLALDLAARADSVASARLASLGGVLAAAVAAGASGPGDTDGTGPPDGMFGTGGPQVPGRGTPPVDVRAWWAGLTAAQRCWLVANRPGDVGGLDGVPAADRDIANRLRLAAEIDAATRRRDELRGPTQWVDAARFSAAEARLRALDSIAARLAAGDRPRAYLLDLDVAGDGRAIVAVGDPDHATDVLTYVPGLNPGLTGVGGLIDRTDTLAAAAARLDGAHRLSAVLWLGYDAPELASAMSASAAHAAEPALDRFADGLRVTHEGAPAHQTVLGHSYGSLVAGVTARDAGLNADDVVFVGSPGVGVPTVDGLHLPAGHVWSSTAANDPIDHLAPGFGQVLDDVRHDLTAPLSRWYGDPLPDEELWHGRNPSTSTFGAHVFASDPRGGHSGYFTGVGLDNIVRIALGGDHLAEVH